MFSVHDDRPAVTVADARHRWFERIAALLASLLQVTKFAVYESHGSGLESMSTYPPFPVIPVPAGAQVVRRLATPIA